MKTFRSFFKRLFIKFAQIYIPLSIGIIVTWFIRGYLISKGLNLNVFLDFYFLTILACYSSIGIKQGISELLASYIFTPGAGVNYMADLSNTTGSNPVEKNIGEKSGVGNNGADPNKAVANTQQYISSGPDKLISEKQELLKLSGDFYPRTQAGPLQEALRRFRSSEPAEYLSVNFPENLIERDKNSLYKLNLVKDYFDALDAGREPADEAVKAFKERQTRYLSFASNDNWKGPFIDFNDKSNVRKEAMDDLEYKKTYVDLSDMVTKAFANEKIAEGPAAKADFYKRLGDISEQHYLKHDKFYKDNASRENAFHDTWDEKTILWMLETITKQQKQFFNESLNGWIEEKANRDLFQKWSQDKINQDFIEKWLRDNKNIK